MIGDDKISEIRERASIVEVVSDHLTLKKLGRNHIGLCPFHSEKTPSFTVNDEKGIFHCFGCDVGGNVFNFLMKFERLTFPEAVERVAKRYGIRVDPVERPSARREEKEGLSRLNEKAANYFYKALRDHSEGARAAKYLRQRGVEDQVARQFYLGYAPASSQGLVQSFQKEGVSMKDAVTLGLLSEKGPNRYAEKFFGRLMFPIVDPGGKVVGFGGRVIGEGFPKYLNSAETPLFRKGSQLYGLYQAKEAIRSMDRVVVVEGYLDVLALTQAGLPSVVATLGTALTPDHVRILRRYTKNVIALFDGDGAGRKAAARSFEIFLEGGLLGQGAFLPQGEDPDTFVRSKGKEALEKIIDQAIPLADFYFTWLQGQYGESLEGKSQIAQEISRVLTKVKSPFEYDLLSRRAADFLGIREELLRRSPAQNPGVQSPRRGPLERESARQMPEDMAESSLVTLMLRFPSAVRRLEGEAELERIFSPKWWEIVDKILSTWRERGAIDMASLTEEFTPDQTSAVTALVLRGENIEETECDQMTDDCIVHLKVKHLKKMEQDLCNAIRLAEEKKDDKARKERILEWQEVVQKERNLERQRFSLRTTMH